MGCGKVKILILMCGGGNWFIMGIVGIMLVEVLFVFYKSDGVF